MKIEQRQYISEKWSSEEINTSAQLVLVFIAPDFLRDSNNIDVHSLLKSFYPQSDIVYISTYWEILGNSIFDKSISITAMTFDKTPIKLVSWEVNNIENSIEVASKLAKELLSNDLKHILVFSDGLWVNGSELIKWMKEILPRNIWVTWWLAWDNPDVINTYAWLNSFSVEKNNIVMIWLYGDSIKIWSCSVSWWTKFGIKRTITKSKWNIVYEVDWEPALELYKDYLWDKSWLFYPIPISIFDKNEDEAVVRTLLRINKEDKSVVFSSDVPEWYSAYFMKASYDDIIKWAGSSTRESYKLNPHPQIALLVNCISRRMVLRQRIEEEIEEVISVVWKDCKIAWFYSYGEIWKNISIDSDYFLHNQTMTTILISED